MRTKSLSIISLLVIASFLITTCGATPEPQTGVQTVEVEKTVVETVEVEKQVVETVEVEKTVVEEKEVEVVVTATAPPPMPINPNPGISKSCISETSKSAARWKCSAAARIRSAPPPRRERTSMSWAGEDARAVNLWRRWYLAHILPRPIGLP